MSSEGFYAYPNIGSGLKINDSIAVWKKKEKLPALDYNDCLKTIHLVSKCKTHRFISGVDNKCVNQKRTSSSQNRLYFDRNILQFHDSNCCYSTWLGTEVRHQLIASVGETKAK